MSRLVLARGAPRLVRARALDGDRRPPRADVDAGGLNLDITLDE
ncbi:hypothetical protein [Actinomadura formosensis]|nr:hypothetical protein [Actinomadura formosensis]